MTDEVLDLEIGQFALRSFKYIERVPWIDDCARCWTDGKVRYWASPSYTHFGDWMDGTCTARCGRMTHDPPGDHCQCGIYGSLSYADLLASFKYEARELVVTIAAEGTTIIGTRGLRTAYARVVGYWLKPRSMARTLTDSDTGETTLIQMPDEVTPEVTAKQFPDAKRFECPYDMVAHFGLNLLPPVDATDEHCRGPSWWTG
jgi:hypothetical protein